MSSLNSQYIVLHAWSTVRNSTVVMFPLMVIPLQFEQSEYCFALSAAMDSASVIVALPVYSTSFSLGLLPRILRL